MQDTRQKYTADYYRKHICDTFNPDGSLATDWARRRVTRVFMLLDAESLRGIVVDAGCGIGTFAALLSRNAQVVALDFSHEAISTAKSVVGTYGNKRVCDFIVCDVAYLPLENSSVQTIVAADLAEHLSDEHFEGFLSNCRRVLRDDGILALYTPNATNIFRLGYTRKRVWPFNNPARTLD